MPFLPESFKKYKTEAVKLLAEGVVGEIEFAGGTYQIQIKDPSADEPWAFLQFEDSGKLKDHFCSCDASSCVHQAVAYLAVFQGHPSPLHIRLASSLWNQLCLIYYERYGDDIENIQSLKGLYSIRASKKYPKFWAKGTTAYGKQKLREIFQERKEETEESSLKFSNLSPEEILLWKEGRPSSFLKYELSFWSDLAKLLMVKQDKGEEYVIDFSFDAAKMPDGLDIKFKDFELHFSIDESDLHAIIPALVTVKAPLKAHFSEERSIQTITYDPKAVELHITPKTAFLKKQQELKSIGHLLKNWIYIPGDGFYAREQHHLLETPIIKEKDLPKTFDEHMPLIKKFMQGTMVNQNPEHLSYHITFDTEWNLHIDAYLKKIGDLQLPDSRYFDNWVYIQDQGFFKIERLYFDAAKVTIPSEEVADFVSSHRAWFNTQEGFQIHIAGVESKLDYRLTQENDLVFFKKAIVDEASQQIKDFDNWVYIEGKGFFAKTDSGIGPALRSGMTVNMNQISLFLHSHHTELQFIPNFFSPVCPIENYYVDIELTSSMTILILPGINKKPDYQNKLVKIFDDCTYVENEGFFVIPPSTLLPEKYRHAQEIDREGFHRFFTYEWNDIIKYARSIDSRLTPPNSLKLICPLLTLQKDGYQLDLTYQSEKGDVDASKIWTAIHNKDRYFFSKAGLFDLGEDRFKWLSTIKKNQLDRRSNKWTLSSLDVLRLYVYEQLHVKEGNDLYQELIEFKLKEEPDLTHLKSHLRPYQHQGVKWLWFLYRHKLSGLLCDDMGLGKTHQAMALLTAVANYRNLHQQGKSHFLVVCPTSVIFHWEDKLKEFLPSLKICTFHGSNRNLKDFHHEYDVLLTSYGIWRNEAELLSKVPFEIAIFDEIQAAKVQTSGIHQSLLKVSAITKIGLTGTPIENRLRELKALFDLVLPRYMPAESEYKQFFVNPIEREGNQLRKQQLSRFIKPFVLRRIKKDVLIDLPEKVEEISHCELSPSQASLYTEVLHKMREGLLQQLQDKSNPIPYLHIFSVLSSLKQICNHPAAYLKEPQNYKNYQSGKWDLFLELLNEAQDSGQKVVVFSQYLAMLDIIEDYLQEHQISYAAIRGATTDRGEQVKMFNQNPECKVFVGSLQAAGLGIDLTAASVVIHYDRWWNAAREDQATDRVHRIGQTRGVQVFKLVTKGTFEERIDAMISRKGKLMEEIIGIDDHQFVKTFDRNELMQLLQDIE